MIYSNFGFSFCHRGPFSQIHSVLLPKKTGKGGKSGSASQEF